MERNGYLVDTDDIRPKVAQDHAAKGCRGKASHFDHFDTSQSHFVVGNKLMNKPNVD